MAQPHANQQAAATTSTIEAIDRKTALAASRHRATATFSSCSSCSCIYSISQLRSGTKFCQVSTPAHQDEGVLGRIQREGTEDPFGWVTSTANVEPRSVAMALRRPVHRSSCNSTAGASGNP